MKRLFLFALIAAFIVPLIASAQPTIRKVYTDSLTATGVTTTAKTTRGYDTKEYLTSDIAAYRDKLMIFRFAKITDSVRIWGVYAYGKVGTSGAKDSAAVPLWVKVKRPTTPVFIAGLTNPQRPDTTVQWISPYLTDQMSHVVDLSEYFFERYFIGSGLNDSGKVWFQDIRRGGY